MENIKIRVKNYLNFRRTHPNVQEDFKNIRKVQYVGVGVLALIGIIAFNMGCWQPNLPEDVCVFIMHILVFTMIYKCFTQQYPLERPSLISLLSQWLNDTLIWILSFMIVINIILALEQDGVKGIVWGLGIWLFGFASLKVWSCLFHYCWGNFGEIKNNKNLDI